MTSIVLINFHFLVLKAYTQNFAENCPVVSEEGEFKFSYVNGLGPRSRNDVDLQYSHTFSYTIRCLHPPIFMPLAAIVSEKFTVFTFSCRKP